MADAALSPDPAAEAAGIVGTIPGDGDGDAGDDGPTIDDTPGAGGTADPPARGFPGFPAGDPRQPPLSQRPRGLDAPPVPGGGDPALRETIARERPYLRLLVGMVAVIVGGSLILTLLAIISAAILR